MPRWSAWILRGAQIVKAVPKRIIISRKGFDQATGGCPSPIFPDGTMLSLPIPENERHKIGANHTRYGDLGKRGILQIPAAWMKGNGEKISISGQVHLDPDLRPWLRPKSASSKASKLLLFGQVEQAQAHLRNRNVEAGDLFLFFGLFKAAIDDRVCLQFKRSAHKKHVLWGWLQIGQIHPLDGYSVPKTLRWAGHHPHLQFGKRANNCIYVASSHLTFAPTLAGGGVFERYDEALSLTTLNEERCSHWTLPAFFADAEMSYLHCENWRQTGSVIQGRSPGRGQEFVMSTEGVEAEAMKWLKSIFKHAGRRNKP